MVRELDATVAEIPGLEGLRLLEHVLDEALERPARVPAGRGWSPHPLRTNACGERPGLIRPAAWAILSI